MTVPTPNDDDSKRESVPSKATSPASSIIDIFSIPVSFQDFWKEEELPLFSLDAERYDQTTYYGRYRKMVDIVDPRTLFCSQKEIDESVQLIKDFASHVEQNPISTTCDHHFDNAALWRAKKTRDAVLHPDTNEMIPKPFRMSGFMPFNAPVCLGALMAMSTPSVLFFHWANQTHNALINYHNRNATQPIDTSAFLTGYCGAVGGAIGVAMGLKTSIERSTRLSVTQKLRYQRFAALPAIVTAGAINMLMMRWRELTTGIDVYYEDSSNSSSHIVSGSSQLAATKALKEMTASRMVLPLPIFLMVPLGMSMIEPILRKNRRLSLPFQTAFVLLGFSLGLPATIALFPQIGTIESSDLEEKFQNLRDSRGNPVTVFRYNKGL